MASINDNLPFQNSDGNTGSNSCGASVTDIRRYLRGVQSLAKEAHASADRRVLVLALHVLAVQGSTIATMEGRA